MAIVSGIPITKEQWLALYDYTSEESELRISIWPDSVTVDNGDTVIIELTLEAE